MSGLPEAFYHQDGDRFVPTALCIGPWHAGLQHGGPPSALLARALQAAAPPGFQLTRFTVDLLRPVPLAPVRVSAALTRAGRLASWCTATLLDDQGRSCANATASFVRIGSVALPEPTTPPPTTPPSPAGLSPFSFPFFPAEIAYHCGVDVFLVDGRWPLTPCTAWMRLRAPLIFGEPTAPEQALLTLADACNGLAPAVPDLSASFVNADLSVHLLRAPVGDLFAFAARSVAFGSGMGLVQAQLFDKQGELGRSAQSLVIEAR